MAAMMTTLSKAKTSPRTRSLEGRELREVRLFFISINNVEETESEEDADDESDMSDPSKKKFRGNTIKNMGSSSLATGDATGKLFYV
jgi:hypothetical protein